jgi:hypothetical protein
VSAVSPIVLLLLLVAIVVGGLMVLVATGRAGDGIGLPDRRRRTRSARRSRDLR